MFITCWIGVVDQNIREAVVFACGPEVMYMPLMDKLKGKGIPPSRIFLSFERQMRCGIGKCWHCYGGSKLVCLDGPVFSGEEADRCGLLR